MIWRTGDMIDVCREINADGIVFTANSVVYHNKLVMGAGAAKRVQDFFPDSIASALGKQIQVSGFGVQPDYFLAGVTLPSKHDLERSFYIFALQVKRDFRHDGDLELTKESLRQLNQWCQDNPTVTLVLNCPLIGLGGFASKKDFIKDMVEDILGDTNIIVTIL